MSALAEIVASGVRLSVNGDKLHVEPMGDGELDPALLDRLRAEKPRLLPLLRMAEIACTGLDLDAGELVAGLTPEDSRAFLTGAEGQAVLTAYAQAVACRKTREAGKVPEHYTAMTVCDHCGSVPTFPDCPPTVRGCVWCWNRIKGLPMPPMEISEL